MTIESITRAVSNIALQFGDGTQDSQTHMVTSLTHTNTHTLTHTHTNTHTHSHTHTVTHSHTLCPG